MENWAAWFFGVILTLAGLATLVGAFMGTLGAVWGTGLTFVEGGIGRVAAVAGLLIILGARKQMKGQAQEVDVKFVPKKIARLYSGIDPLVCHIGSFTLLDNT